MKSFREKVRAVVAKIPKGKSMTYKEVAARAGNPKAARAVGAIMRSNYNRDIPCHRVVKSDGTVNYETPTGADFSSTQKLLQRGFESGTESYTEVNNWKRGLDEHERE